MASQKIDELQIQISSDARTAIGQLNSLAAALNNTATAASSLTSATGSLNGFASAISKLASADAQTAVANIKELNRALGGKNLQSKKVSVDIAVNGLENIQKLQNLAMPKVGRINLKDTGINAYVNALRRLADVDMSKFDMSFLDEISKAMNSVGQLGNIDKSITKFVSAITRLANVGYKTKIAAVGLPALAQALEDIVKRMQGLGDISSDISIFIAALGKLASAGKNTGETAKGLFALTFAVVHFLEEVSKAPQPSADMATTIQGLGMLAVAGQNAGKAMKDFASSNNSAWVGVFKSGFSAYVKTAVHDIGDLIIKLKDLSLFGVKSLGSFLQRLHMLPGGTKHVNNMALSFGNLLRAVLPFYGIRGVFDWLKESFNLGSSIVELQNVIDTAFGSVINGYRDISGYIYNWSKDTIDAFGVSEIAAQRYAGKLMSMFNSSGFDATEQMRDSAAKMTTDLVERAGDIASFYDISVDEAMTKMQSALAGMTRPMRALGVNMNVANLEAFALSHGINQSWKEMDQATQMAVRYAYMLDATKYAAGDFGRTSQSAANGVRLLQLNTQQLSATLGQGLVSAIAPVIGWLNGLIKRLIQAAVAFRTFMWTLFGKPLAAVRGLVDDTAGYLDDAAGAASDLGSAGGGAADGLGSAGSAAKDLKKQLTLLPFDQLNQLAKDTDSAGSGGSGGGGGGGGGIGGLGDMGDLGIMPDLGDALTDSPVINAVNQWAARIREAFQKQQWSKLGYIVAEGINAGFQYIYDALDWAKLKPIIVDGFITPFQTVINSMMDGIDWNLIGKTFGRGLMDIVYTLRAWITGFKWREYGVDFAEGLNGFIDEIHPDQIGRLIADKFKAAWDFFGGWVSTFDFSGLGYSLRDGLVAFIDELDPKDMGESLGKFLNGIADTILAFLGDESVKESLASSFAEFVNGFIKELDAPKIKEALKSVSNTIFGALKQAFHEIDIMPLVGDIVTILSGLPWSFIWKSILAHATLSLGKALAGGIFSKVLTDALVAAFTGGGGAGTVAGVAAKTTTTATVASATSGGAAATGGATAAAGLGAGGLGALAGVLAPLAGLAVVMRKQVNKTGGVGQFQGQNLAPSYQQPKQAPVSSGQSNTGYSPKVQTAPITPSPQTQTPISIPDIIANVKTTLFGQKDPSFTNLELAKSSLLQTPIVKKIMNGELTSGFKDGYKKFTDTKPYNAVKGFGASVSQTFKTWWGRNVDRKNYNSTKGMNASI